MRRKFNDQSAAVNQASGHLNVKLLYTAVLLAILSIKRRSSK